MRFLALLLLFATFIGATNIVLLIDDSGSMDDNLPDGTRKIDAAKTAANHLLDRVRSSDQVALMVFYSCSDIRAEQSFTREFTGMRAKINALEPDGSTPIADAIVEAKTYIQSNTGTGVIILLTDGEETCGGEPIDAARQAHDAGITTAIHVVGYDITPGSSEEQQLQQVAAAGGGNYYPAENATALDQALGQAYDTSSGGSSLCCGLGLAILLGFGFAAYRIKKNS